MEHEKNNPVFDKAFPRDEWGQRVGWMDRRQAGIGQRVNFHASDSEVNKMLLECAALPEYVAYEQAKAIAHARIYAPIFDPVAIKQAVAEECQADLALRVALHTLVKRILAETDAAQMERYGETINPKTGDPS